MGIVYLITNIVNNKKYVGFTTKNEKLRFREHVRNALKKSLKSPLYSAIRKYGEESFLINVLETHEDDNYALTVLEPKYIKIYDTYKSGYNCTFGGEGTLGLKLTPERLSHLKSVNLGRKQSIETIEKRRIQITGKKRTPKSIKNYSEANRKRVIDGDHNFLKLKGTIWITNPITLESIRISNSDLENFLNLGWIRGRKKSKLIWINNEIVEKMISITTFEEYKNWKRGRLKSAFPNLL